MLAGGSGVGDAITCIPLRFADGSPPYGVRVDCTAPGAATSSKLSSAAVIGIAVGCSLGGLVLLTLLGCWCYRRFKTAESDKIRASMGMNSNINHGPAHTTQSNHRNTFHDLGAGGPGVVTQQLAFVALLGLVCVGLPADGRYNGSPTDLIELASHLVPLNAVDDFMQQSHCSGHLFASIAHIILVLGKSGVFILAPVLALITCCRVGRTPGTSGSGEKDLGLAFLLAVLVGTITFFGLAGGVAFFWEPFFTYAADATREGTCSNSAGLFWMMFAPLWSTLTSKLFWGGFVVFCAVKKWQGK